MKELNMGKKVRNESMSWYEEFYRKMKDYSEAEVVEIAGVIGNSYEAAYIMQCTATLVLEVCAAFEVEVERLREENETLKKQMEDDLK